MFDIKIDRNKEETLYRQIYNQIKAEILQDRYTPDTRMPSIRKLAARLGVNNETVVKAYDLLAEEKLIYKQEGSGSYIAPAGGKKNSKDDQRLRILSSKETHKANITDFSAFKSGREFLREFSFDFIFDSLYAKIGGNIFKEALGENAWQQRLEFFSELYSHQALYYNSEAEIEGFLVKLFKDDDLILFESPSEIGPFEFIISKSSEADLGAEDKEIKNESGPNILKINRPNYESLMDYLQENKIDYLVLSDEFLFSDILKWGFSKLNSLLELADMLKFKLVILESYYLFSEKEIIENLMESDYRNSIILIRQLSSRVFPGLNIGLVYMPENYHSSGDSKFNNMFLENKFNNSSAGDNLIQNLFSYYIEKSFLSKRIKLLKQRLKNRNLLLKEELEKYFRDISVRKSSSLFYTEIELNNELDFSEFNNFAQKRGVLLPENSSFLLKNKSKSFILSAACLDQFSIKQGVMNLAKIFRNYNY